MGRIIIGLSDSEAEEISDECSRYFRENFPEQASQRRTDFNRQFGAPQQHSKPEEPRRYH